MYSKEEFNLWLPDCTTIAIFPPFLRPAILPFVISVPNCNPFVDRDSGHGSAAFVTVEAVVIKISYLQHDPKPYYSEPQAT